MQIELKFRIAPEGLPAFRRHPLLARCASSKTPARQCTDIYFDTPDFLLQRHSVALYVTRVGKRWKRVLAANAGLLAPRRQREWEADLSDASPDCAAITRLFLDERELQSCRFDESICATLIPMFTIDCRRESWHLEFGQGCGAELTLSRGELHCRNARAPVCELCIVHRTGAPDACLEFALAIQRDFKLHLAYRSQADVGYALRDLKQVRAFNAEPLILPSDLDIEQGMESIFRSCMQHIFGNAAGVLKDGEMECIHQMRVGLRRLRSALDIFAPLKPCPEKIRLELAWLSSRLGDARDWDVFDASAIPAFVERAGEAAGLAALRKQVRREINRTHRQAAVAVDSLRCTRLWLNLERWLAAANGMGMMPDSSEETRPMLLRDFAEQNVKRFHKKMLKRCVSMNASEARSRHRLRIASKKLRYATEFFVSYYRKKPAARFLRKLAKLQDIFGASNDTAVAGRLLRTLAQKHPDLSKICDDVWDGLIAVDQRRVQKLGKRVRRVSMLKRLQLRKS